MKKHEHWLINTRLYRQAYPIVVSAWLTILHPVRLADGWWLMLICSERKVLLASCWWLLVCSERKVLLDGG
jgi:hypothetical protein